MKSTAPIKCIKSGLYEMLLGGALYRIRKVKIGGYWHKSVYPQWINILSEWHPQEICWRVSCNGVLIDSFI